MEIKIAAKVIGFVTINVKAVGNSAGDGIEEKMRIVPEGVPKYITNGTFIQLTEDSVVNKSLICDLPPNAGKIWSRFLSKYLTVCNNYSIGHRDSFSNCCWRHHRKFIIQY